ncbi:uncharacterized protein K02A2.6-like [Solenopsis invicta]|uniref:uncharacterized protein K02A2.6-like n=1 Tax=Solenopsis invicta TaxID=13686 RepID=UPI000595FBB1|nr:uncharacterized protein K02A2.6-like [Solenopsis invicta]
MPTNAGQEIAVTTAIPNLFTTKAFDANVTMWRRWLQRLLGAFKIFNITGDARVPYLLHYVDSAAFDILCDRLDPKDLFKQTFELLTAKLEEFYALPPLEIAENFKFHQRSIHCKFGDYLKTALRNQLIFGLASKKTQTRLLEKKDLTYDKALKIATTMELSEKGSESLQEALVRNAISVDSYNRMRQSSFSFTMYPQPGDTLKRTNELEEVLSLEQQQYRDKFTSTLNVDGKLVQFEVDSGSGVTVMSEILVKCNRIQKKLNIYISEIERKPLLGREWIRQLKASGGVYDFLECSALEIDNRGNNHTKLKCILEKYEELGSDTWTKIVGVQANLTLRPNVKPIFLKARSVPFKLTPLVDKAIGALVKVGVLTKTETAEWAMPIVPILKADGTVQICGDYKSTVNPQLMVDNHPLPTTDDLFVKLLGGKRFS